MSTLDLGPITTTVTAQLEQAGEEQYTSFAKREPVILTHLIASPVLGLVALLAPGQADKLAEQITAAAVALAVGLQGFLVRRYVAPAWKRATGRAFPDPASYGDAFDDGSGVPHPTTPPPSPRDPNAVADDATGVIPPPLDRPLPGRHGLGQ